MPSPERIGPLDGLRGLAVLAVLLYHAAVFEPAASPAGRAFLAVARLGWAGVDLFFVLSGFLITRILAESRGASNYFRVFYARRFLRIFPLYYVSLLVLVLLFRVSAGESAWYWLYASNVKMTLDGWPSAPLSHFWSLAVEEQYYLAWPLVVSLLPRRALVALCAALVLLVPAARVAGFVGGVPELGLYVLTPFRLDGLAAGSLLALLLPGLGDPRRYVPHAVGVLGVSSVATGVVLGRAGDAFWGTPPMLTLGFTLLAIAFAALVFLAVALPAGSAWPRLLEARPLRAAGKVSYAMYVFHWPVTFALREAGFRPAAIAPGALGWAAYLGGLLAAVALLASLSWRVLEGPCLALKDRLAYRFPEQAPPKG